MASIRIIEEKCIGCKKCVPACPFGALEVRGDNAKTRKAVILDNCTLCGSCVSECKFNAIELIKDEVVNNDIEKYAGVWVYCEQFLAGLRPVALELLGEGRKIADQLDTELTAVILGNGIFKHADTLIAHGADKVLVVEDPKLEQLHDLNYTDAMAKMVEKYLPSIILLGATSFGRSFAPRLAAKLSTGLTADCTVLAADKEKGLLLQTRPAFGGNVMATIICPNSRPQMATVRPKVFTPPVPDNNRKGEVIEEKVTSIKDSAVEITKLIKDSDQEGFNIGDADILIAVGKGIGNAKNIALAEELARLLGGAVAVSRPLVDNAWYKYSHQVGQTGKTVAPKLYIACGVSGAIQHVAGVAAETIVAVNNDPDAPIFNYAHYAINGDCVEFLQTMIDQVKEQGIHGF